MDETRQQPAATPKKVRRVGRIAFALLLIAAGVLLLVQQFVPRFDLLSIVRFAPALLIVLGVELLVYTSRPDIQVKFDWLSLVGCGFILLVVGCSSLVPVVWNLYGPQRDYARSKYQSQLQSQAYQALNADTDLKARINSLYISVWFNHTESGEYTLQDVDEVDLHLELAPGSYDNAGDFAADCYRITQLLRQGGLPVDEYQYDSSNVVNATGDRYSLHFLSDFFDGLTEEQLAQRVSCSYEYEGNTYGSLAERDADVRQMLAQRITEDYVAEHDGEYPTDETLNAEVEKQFQALFPTGSEAATPETAA